jgi:hypothetical protein
MYTIIKEIPSTCYLHPKSVRVMVTIKSWTVEKRVSEFTE